MSGLTWFCLFFSYWVCEKSDGIRILFLVVTLQTNEQMTYIVRIVQLVNLVFQSDQLQILKRSTGIIPIGKFTDYTFPITKIP